MNIAWVDLVDFDLMFKVCCTSWLSEECGGPVGFISLRLFGKHGRQIVQRRDGEADGDAPC